MTAASLPCGFRRSANRVLGLATVGALAVSGAGCQQQSDEQTTVDVLAASSLTDVFAELEQVFEQSHPNIDIRIAYAGSHILRAQIERGAQADVFVSASLEHVDALVSGGWVQNAHVIAHNSVMVIAPRDNPAGLSSFDDLPNATRIVLGSANVPIGRYTRDALSRRGADFAAAVHAHVVSEESNARLVRIKVLLGDADAAIVYRSDAVAGAANYNGYEPIDGLLAFDVPTELSPPIAYYAATSTDRTSALAGSPTNAWAAFLTSEGARAVFERHLFSTPTRTARIEP